MSEAPPVVPKIEGDLGGWRERLLKSLRECGVQPAPKFVFLRYFFAVVLTIGYVAAYMAIRLLDGMARRGDVPIGVVAAIQIPYFLFGMGIFLFIRNAVLRNAWRASARSAERELSKRNARRPVFYLRSFAMDQTRGRTTLWGIMTGNYPLISTEQRLTSRLRKIGPVIAIGRPGEKLPELGASRFYVPNDLWQQKVSEVVRESQLVAWMSGHSNGLGWELEHLRDNIDPQKLLLCAHPYAMGLRAADREREWQLFLSKFGSYFPKPLPQKLGEARYFVFDSQWTPIPAPPRMSAIWAKPNVSALKRAIELTQKKVDGKNSQYLSELSQNRDCRYFGDVIGARKVERDWPRLIGFALAMCLAFFVMSGVARWFESEKFKDTRFAWSFSYFTSMARDCFSTVLAPGALSSLLVMLIYDLVDAALLAGAYRLIRKSVVAIPLGVAIQKALQWLRGGGISLRGIGYESTRLGSLALAVSNSSRLMIGLFVGTWIGAFLTESVFRFLYEFQKSHFYSAKWTPDDLINFSSEKSYIFLLWGPALATVNALTFLFVFCLILKLLALVWPKGD